MNAMILAAGLGQRLRPHTLNKAKPSLPFLNIPLLSYSFSYLDGLKVKKFVFNTHHEPESIRRAAQQFRSPHKPEIKFTFESPYLLGSGGGLKLAESHLRGGGHFLLANGDEFLICPQGLHSFWDNHLSSGALATLLVCNHDEVGSRFGGVWTNEENQVIGFGKTPSPGSTRGYHYTGIMALADRVFDYIPYGIVSNILYDHLTQAIRQGDEVRIFFPERIIWYETGSEQDFLFASFMCLNHLNESSEFGANLIQILKAQDPFLIHQGQGIWLGKDTQIPSSAQILGPCIIGSHSILGEGTIIKGPVVMGNECLIERDSQLERTVIGHQIKIESNQKLNDFLLL